MLNRLIKRDPNDVRHTIDRAFFEADRGRVSLALVRVADLHDEFPSNPHVDYAEGVLRRDFLGQAQKAREALERAFNATTRAGPAQTRWYATCNLIELAADEQEFRHWFDIALKEQDPGLPEFAEFRRVETAIQSGTPFVQILFQRASGHAKAGNHGAAAAMLELALASPPPGGESPWDMHLARARHLRALDKAAESCRTTLHEAFPPDERVVLVEGVGELEAAAKLDPYDATTWNLMSAWCVLSRQYPRAVALADKAIDLRPNGYFRPHVNRAKALVEMGRSSEALISARCAYDQAVSANESPADIQECSRLVKAYAAPASTCPPIRSILAGAAATSAHELAQYGPNVSLAQIVQRIKAKLNRWRVSVDDTLRLTAELLVDFSAETAAAAHRHLKSAARIHDRLLMGAAYLATKAHEPLGRDTTRYLALRSLQCVEEPRENGCYSKLLAISCVASGELATLADRVRTELARIHPDLADKIAPDAAPTAAELRHALKTVVKPLVDYERDERTRA